MKRVQEFILYAASIFAWFGIADTANANNDTTIYGTAVNPGDVVVKADPGSGGLIITLVAKSNMLRGASSSAGTGATTLTGMSAQGAAVKIYITDFECSNSGGTNSIVHLNDSSTFRMLVPTVGGNNQHFSIPLVIAANTDAQFTSETAETTMFCNAQGYQGS